MQEDLNNNENIIKKKIKLDFKDSKYATGRRKKSIARVWMKKGSGKIYVNGKNMNDYFTRSTHQTLVSRPLEEVKRSSEFDVKCLVRGGGLSGQAGAIIHGIARAIIKYEPELKSTLKKKKLTTRDSRSVERKNTVEKKLEEVFNFLKDSFYLVINDLIYLIYLKYEKKHKCSCCRCNRLYRIRIN